MENVRRKGVVKIIAYFRWGDKVDLSSRFWEGRRRRRERFAFEAGEEGRYDTADRTGQNPLLLFLPKVHFRISAAWYCRFSGTGLAGPQKKWQKKSQLPPIFWLLLRATNEGTQKRLSPTYSVPLFPSPLPACAHTAP